MDLHHGTVGRLFLSPLFKVRKKGGGQPRTLPSYETDTTAITSGVEGCGWLGGEFPENRRLLRKHINIKPNLNQAQGSPQNTTAYWCKAYDIRFYNLIPAKTHFMESELKYWRWRTQPTLTCVYSIPWYPSLDCILALTWKRMLITSCAFILASQGFDWGTNLNSERYL